MTNPNLSGPLVVLTAIDDELKKERAPDGVEVIYTGVGKVNAAHVAALTVLALQPKLVINYIMALWKSRMSFSATWRRCRWRRAGARRSHRRWIACRQGLAT